MNAITPTAPGFAHLVTARSVTLFIDGKQINIPKAEDGRYEKIVELINIGQRSQAVEVAKSAVETLKETLKLTLPGQVIEVLHGRVLINGKINDSGLANHIVELAQRQIPVKHLMAFLGRVSINPSFRARQDLFAWITANDMPVTDDGHFIAFKVVLENYMDIYTGKTFRHRVGDVIEMDRGDVDENPDKTCSQGAHFCGEKYIPSYGSKNSSTDRVVVLDVDPAEVVAFPRDYNLAKGRACGYTVIGEMSREEVSDYFAERSRTIWG